jgi:hypothetical protein
MPGEVRFSIDFRAVEALDSKWKQIEPVVQSIASTCHLTLELRQMSATEAVALSPVIQERLEYICERRGLLWMRMPSGAVHDA